MGWYEGFHLLLCVTAQGVITGFGFASASTHDQHLAATLFAARHTPSRQLTSGGLPAHGSYLADKGFAGERPRQQWAALYQIDVVTPPHQTSKRQRWPKALRRWFASLRQIIQTVNDKLLNTFRLARERPHEPLGISGSSGSDQWRCTIFASGSIANLTMSLWLLLSCFNGRTTHENSPQTLKNG